jgi:hypothetical protein
VQKVLHAPKQVIYGFQRYITGRGFALFEALHLYKRDIGAKNPWWGTGMQFAPL